MSNISNAKITRIAHKSWVRECLPEVGSRGYLIGTTNVSPNAVRSGYSTEYHHLADQPGRTNMSNEERLRGWLGTTNDIQEYAYGYVEVIEVNRLNIVVRDVRPPEAEV